MSSHGENTAGNKNARSGRAVYVAVTLGVALAAAALFFYIGLAESGEGEYCNFVQGDEAYHIVVNDMNCRLTARALWEPLLFFVILAGILQLPVMMAGLTNLIRKGMQK